MYEGGDVLLTMLIDSAAQRGWRCRRLDVNTVVVDGPAGYFTTSLSDLRRLAAHEPEPYWPVLVRDYLSNGIAAAEIEYDAPLDESDFGMMRGLVRTRLYSSNDSAENAVRRMLAPGLVQRVVLDMVHIVRPVTYSTLEQWPIGEQQLFAIAEANVRGDDPAEVATQEFDGVDMAEGLPISMLFGPEYVTAHIRWLGEYPVIGRAGAIVIAPSKRFVYAIPANTIDDSLRATLVLARLAVAHHREQPWPVSPHVYMWRRGQLDLAATAKSTDDGVVIQPTDEFQQWLGTLSS